MQRLLFLPVFILFIAFSYLFKTFYPDYLWFQSFNFQDVWWFTLKTRWVVFAALFTLTFFVLRLNLSITRFIAGRTVTTGQPRFSTPFKGLNDFLTQLSQAQTNSKQSLPAVILRGLSTLGVFIVSIMVALSFSTNWETIFSFIHQTSFNVADPIFKQDLSFYFFSLPMIELAKNWFSTVLILSFAFSGFLYFQQNILLFLFSKDIKNTGLRVHLFLLLGLFFMIVAFGAYLNVYSLLYSNRGAVFGASYTDIHAQLWGFKVLAGALLIQALLFIISAFRSISMLPFMTLGLVFVLSILVNSVYPNFVQKFVVNPNELKKESPYIAHNINYTRMAYGLDSIEMTSFPVDQTLTQSDLQNNDNIVDNIRLWNQEPLKQTFSQLQEIRLYYEFSNVDVDRYSIDGAMKQVMLSAREIDTSQLSSQAQTWINQRLIYTHGYGLVMTPVSRVTPEGLPYFYVKDLPPRSEISHEVTQPEIYFGEKNNGYRILNTHEREFNYPKVGQNVYVNYQGSGGIQLNSLFKRLVFSWKFSDIKILISSLIHDKSRLVFESDIRSIVKKITPFIAYDRDPYLVLRDNGRLVWMLDGYTLSSRFPYSEPFGRGDLNYIRNAVKVTIDAYSGETRFYAMPGDPIIETYAKFYPNLFNNYASMPHDLKQHIRFPKDLFNLQAAMLRTYHMTDVQVFYNREDLWSFPREIYGETEKQMDAYYMVTKLPGDEKESFVLMMPFTPTNKNNMIAWMTAKCDPDSYGQLRAFKFPKDKTIYGPTQIESRIDQDTEISQKLTLWGQVGSRVIRGNLMVVPVKDSLIYVEPIYLQATQSKLPELKRVIFSYGDKVVMDETLPRAISTLFTGNSQSVIDLEAGFIPDLTKPSSLETLLDQLFNNYDRFKQNARKGNWEQFGKGLGELDRTINSLKHNHKQLNNQKEI